MSKTPQSDKAALEFHKKHGFAVACVSLEFAQTQELRVAALRTNDPLAAGAPSAAPATQEPSNPEGAATCRVCGGRMSPGIGLVPTLIGHPDFPGDTGKEEGCTLTEGPGVFTTVLKCEKCGHSFSGATPPSVTDTAREIENIRAVTQIDRTLQIESILTRLRASDAEELRRHKAALWVARDALKKVSPSNLWDKARMYYDHSDTGASIREWHRKLCDEYESALAAIDKELKEKP